MNRRYLIFLLPLLLLGIMGCEEVQQGRTLKLAHGLPTTHPVHKAMVYMAEECDRISQGQLRIDIYPSQQLGTERECLELLQIGSIAITKVSTAVLENFAPRTKVLSMPYLFQSRAHQFAVLDGPIGQDLLLSPQKYLLRGLCFYDAGYRSFYTKDKKVEAPADLQGLKIRVMESRTAKEMVNAFGGSATPISFGELYSSLQQGVVDGAENNPPSFYTSKHYEVCSYYTLNEHTAIPDVLVMSTLVWEKLSEQEKIWINEAVTTSVPYQRKLWAEAEDEALRAVQEAGVEVVRPLKLPFREKVSFLKTQFADEPSVDSLIQAIQAVPDPERGE